jgi:proline iminopeptidase
MNHPLNAAAQTDPLESRVDELRERLPPDAMIIGGAGDSHPADALRRDALLRALPGRCGGGSPDPSQR